MVTTTVKTIGTTGDYSTLQAWEDAAPADLTAAGGVIWQGQCQNQTFNVGGGNVLVMSGSTSSPTCYKELTTVAGASFRDQAGVQTNPLRLDSTKGATVTSSANYSTAVSNSESYGRVSNLQLGGTSYGAPYYGVANTDCNNCIIEGYRSGSCITYVQGAIRNSLVVNRAGSGYVLKLAANGALAVNCTVVTPSDKTAATNGIFVLGYTSGTVKNCAVFGATTAIVAGYGGSFTATTCYTDQASPPTGFTTVAYDTTTGSGFQNTADATRDFRIKSTSALIDHGTTDATNAATDIAKTARPQGAAYDVGCWEYVLSGTSYSASLALGLQMATNDNTLLGAKGSVSLGVQAATSDNAGLAAVSGVSLGMAAGVSEAGNMAAISALTLGLQAGLADNAINALAGAVSLGSQMGLGTSDKLGVQAATALGLILALTPSDTAAMGAALSLGAILGLVPSQGSTSSYNAGLSLGVIASTGAGDSLAAVSSLALGLGLAITTASIDQINGSLTLGVIAGTGLNAGQTFNVNIPLGLIAGLQTSGGQSFGATMALGLIVGQAIAAATGLQVVPIERILKVQAENRTLSIQVENRTLIVAVENRTITVKLE